LSDPVGKIARAFGYIAAAANAAEPLGSPPSNTRLDGVVVPNLKSVGATKVLELSDKDKELIRLSWTKVMAAPGTGAELFYGRLFERDPALRKLFKGNMEQQGQKLVETINTVVDNLDLDLSDTVLKMGTRHQAYKVVAEDYDKVGSALIWMLDAMVGADFFLTCILRPMPLPELLMQQWSCFLNR